jgi:methionine aminopeptidase
MPYTPRQMTPSEIARIRESEEVFFQRILRVVTSNEVPGMEMWNVDNAADMMRRMKAAYDAAGGYSSRTTEGKS